jgi:hypothetical protein
MVSTESVYEVVLTIVSLAEFPRHVYTNYYIRIEPGHEPSFAYLPLSLAQDGLVQTVSIRKVYVERCY